MNIIQEERRQQMAEAAEKRAQNQQTRGIKDPNSVKRMEQKRDQLEKRQSENVGSNEPNLKVIQRTAKTVINCLF